MKEKILLCWSGGKDSAMSLYELRASGDYEVSALLTTITEDYDRISMHGVQRVLLEQQAKSVGLPIERIYITKGASNEEYETKMKGKLADYQGRGVSSVAFGDIFLEDLRKHRENNLSKIGMKGVFPLWKRNTAELARAFIYLGFKTVVTCVDSKALDGKFAGRVFDEGFLSELPPGIDPCGENGEFHSFVYDGPIFQNPISYRVAGTCLRENRFYYCNILPHRSIL